MKKQLKKIFTMLIILTLCLNTNVLFPKAADVGVIIALSSSNVSIGDTVTVTVSVDGESAGLSGCTLYVTYDSSVLEYKSSSGSAMVNGSGGTLVLSLSSAKGSANITFSAISNGTCYISTSGNEAYDIEGKTLSVIHAGANVTVGTKTEEKTEPDGKTDDEKDDDRSANCKLKSLKVSDGSLDPSFSADTTSYHLKLEEDATSVVISAEPEDSKAKTSVSGADKLRPGENTVRVTVTAENGAVKVYTIRVIVGDEIEEAKTTIDGKEYYIVNTAENLMVPEGFSADVIDYEDWEILAYSAPNKKFLIVCLEDEEGNREWYIYDSQKVVFTKYKEYSAGYNRYVIINMPEGTALPEGFEPATMEIDGNNVEAYQSGKISDRNYYLLYAMNIEGEEGFYLYDKTENTFLRYTDGLFGASYQETATASDATPLSEGKDDDELFTKEFMIYILIGVSALLLIFIILFVTVCVAKKKIKNELEDAEEMINQLSQGTDHVDHTRMQDYTRLVRDDELIYENRRNESLSSLADKINKKEKTPKPEPKTETEADTKQSDKVPENKNKDVPDSQDIKALMSEIDRIMAETEMYKNDGNTNK